MSRRVAALTALACLAAAPVAGCSRDRALDMDRATARITASLDATYGLPVSGLRCPAKVTAGVDRAFTCTVRVGGQPLRVRVVQVSGRGDLRVRPTAAVLASSDVEAQLVAAVKGQLGRKTVVANCRDADVRVVAPGGSFACRVNDGRTRRVVDVTVRDTAGSLSFVIRPG